MVAMATYTNIIFFRQCAIQKYVVPKDFFKVWAVHDFLKVYFFS